MEEKSKAQIVEERVSDFKHSFESGPGKRVDAYLSKFCLEHSSTYVKDCGRKSDFNEGARSVILEIRHWLNYDLTKLDKEQENEYDRIS